MDAKLEAALKQGLKPVYLIQGDERLMVDAAERQILAAAVPDPADTMAVTRVDLAESGRDAKDVVAACRAIGLFVSRIAVVVRAAEVLDKRKADTEEILRYLEHPVSACTLILKATRKLDGKKALSKRLKKKYGPLLDYKTLKPWEAAKWVEGRGKALGHRLDRHTARAIVDLVGEDLLSLSHALDQLSLFVGPGAPITHEAAEHMLAATRSHTVFELVDAVGERRTADAIRHLHAMLSQREQPLRIVAMLIRQFRFVWQLGVLRQRGVALDEATKALRLHPFQAKKMWAQTQKFTAARLRDTYERLYEADLMLKSSPLKGPILTERLVLALAS